MNELLRQLGLTPLKACAIAVLGLVFAIVWGPQLLPMIDGPSPASAGQSSTAPNSVASTGRPPRSETITGGSPPVSPADTARNMPQREFTLTEAIAHDPFEVPAWAPVSKRVASNAAPASGTDQLTRIEKLRQTGVAMVLVSNRQQVAAIGDRLVRLGDEIDGFRVVEISSEGVLLQPTNDDSTPKEPRDL